MACRDTPAVRPLRGIRDLEVQSIAHPDLGEAQGPAARTLLPLARAVARGADIVWVLHVGRLEEELAAPRFLWQVAFVAFEISRRHRVHSDLERVGSEVTVHVLPSGMPQRRAATWLSLRPVRWSRMPQGILGFEDYVDPSLTPRAAARRNRGSASGRDEGLRWKPLRHEPTVPRAANAFRRIQS
jgi:hypothetical protein